MIFDVNSLQLSLELTFQSNISNWCAMGFDATLFGGFLLSNKILGTFYFGELNCIIVHFDKKKYPFSNLNGPEWIRLKQNASECVRSKLSRNDYLCKKRVQNKSTLICITFFSSQRTASQCSNWLFFYFCEWHEVDKDFSTAACFCLDCLIMQE